MHQQIKTLTTSCVIPNGNLAQHLDSEFWTVGFASKPGEQSLGNRQQHNSDREVNLQDGPFPKFHI